jgi:hypothetical protein
MEQEMGGTLPCLVQDCDIVPPQLCLLLGDNGLGDTQHRTAEQESE